MSSRLLCTEGAGGYDVAKVWAAGALQKGDRHVFYGSHFLERDRMTRRLWDRRALVLLALLPLGCARSHGQQGASGESPEALPPYQLSAEEIRTARDLAEQDLEPPEFAGSPHGRVVFTKVELLPDAQAQTTQRIVQVIHYCYRNDEAVVTTVDLNRHEVTRVETIPHLPTALAPQELARAETLARADAQLAPLFRAHGRALKIEGKVLHVTRQDPLFGHRVVVLLFSTGGNYLAEPEVLVDLTTETIRIDVAQ